MANGYPSPLSRPTHLQEAKATNAAHSWSVFIALFVIVALSAVVWVFAPKGENQTYPLPPPLRPGLPANSKTQHLAELIDPYVRCLLHFVEYVLSPLSLLGW